MQSFNDFYHPVHRIQFFFDLVDFLAETKGLNVPQIVDIKELSSFSVDSLGRSWADFLDMNNLKPITSGPRRKQLHDGIHVLTGYGTDPMGEAEIQAFLLGAKLRLTNFLIGLGLLRIIRQRLNYPPAYTRQRLWQAYQRGHNSCFDPDSWKPELLWHLPLTDVQAKFALL